MAHGDELWNLAFSNVGRLPGEPRRDVFRAIQAISGIGPPTNQQRQRMTRTGRCAITISARKCPLSAGGARVTQPAAHARTSQPQKSVGSSSKTAQQHPGTRSRYQYRYWQPNVKGQEKQLPVTSHLPDATTRRRMVSQVGSRTPCMAPHSHGCCADDTEKGETGGRQIPRSTISQLS
jgi:hypothetical protein